MADQIEAVDFAVAAYREDGDWQVEELALDLLADVETLTRALRRFPSDAGALALVAVDEDWFLLLRVTDESSRLLLSDITAAGEWELAASVVDHLRLPHPEEEDDQVPAGDLGLLGDLGMPAADLGALLDDFDLYPDEMLSDVARRLGFGPLFDDAIGLTSA